MIFLVDKHKNPGYCFVTGIFLSLLPAIKREDQQACLDCYLFPGKDTA